MFRLQLPKKDRTLKLKDINSEVQQVIDKNKKPTLTPEQENDFEARVTNLEILVNAIYRGIKEKPKPSGDLGH